MMMESDVGEVLDLVERKGPISLKGIMDQQAVYSQDDVYSALKQLEEEGKVERLDGDLDKYGTTRDVWVSTDAS